MQFKLAFATLAVAFATSFVAAVPVTPTAIINPGPDSANVDGHLYVCTDVNFEGECSNLGFTADVCTNMPPAFQDDISSFGPDAGWVCITWTNDGCSGLTYTASSPGFSSLPNGINDAISSFECFQG